MLRAATERDIPAIIKLIDDNSDRLLHRSEGELRELLSTTWVWEEPEGIVGCATLEIYSPKISEIRNVAVKESVRGQGVGRALIARATAEAKERGIRQVLVVTSTPEYFAKLNFGPCLNEKYALFWNGD